MRIVGGSLRGRKLIAPEGEATRPTSDRVREALFNVLDHHDWRAAPEDPPRKALPGAVVLDAFAGTGALALEALSRGAERAVFFDKSSAARAALTENVRALRLETRCQIHPHNAARPPVAATSATLVFLDPPYHKGFIEKTIPALFETGWATPETLFVLETAKGEPLALPAPLVLLFERSYGDTWVGVAATKAES